MNGFYSLMLPLMNKLGAIRSLIHGSQLFLLLDCTLSIGGNGVFLHGVMQQSETKEKHKFLIDAKMLVADWTKKK